jgi:hypothetical protein
LISNPTFKKVATKASETNASTFKFLTPVTYRNSFLDLEDSDNELSTELSSDIDNFYDGVNELLEYDE